MKFKSIVRDDGLIKVLSEDGIELSNSRLDCTKRVKRGSGYIGGHIENFTIKSTDGSVSLNFVNGISLERSSVASSSHISILLKASKEVIRVEESGSIFINNNECGVKHEDELILNRVCLENETGLLSSFGVNIIDSLILIGSLLCLTEAIGSIQGGY